MGAMTRSPMRALLTLVLAATAGALLGACGSQTKTVTISSAPPSTQPSTATGTTAKTTSAPSTSSTQTSTSAPTGPGGGTSAPEATRTASEPEFAQKEAQAEGLSAATAVLKERGYTPAETSQYHPGQALRVLVGTATGSSDGYGQQAFFFVNGRYIGTDTKEPSATVKVLAQSDTEVTLAYPLYKPGDPLSSPSGGQATVRFQLDNGKLTALNPIPPARSSTQPARN